MTAERADVQTKDLANAALASSSDDRFGLHTAARSHGGSLVPLAQLINQAPRSQTLPHRLLLIEDGKEKPATENEYMQLGRVVEDEDDKDFALHAEQTHRYSTSQTEGSRRVESNYPAWTLLKPPDTPSPATILDTGHFASFATTAVPIDYKMAFLLSFCGYYLCSFYLICRFENSYLAIFILEKLSLRVRDRRRTFFSWANLHF